jgi:hypothetical protein
MQVELKVNDKSVQAEISEEQLKKLGLIEDKPRAGYERVEKGEMYYLVDIYNNIMRVPEDNDQGDEQCYNTGNYYNDKVIAENNARADRLLRQLRQWQAQNDEVISKEDWENDQIDKYCITYGYGDENLYVDHYYSIRLPNTIHFTTKEKAKEAIEVFKDELLWYFTEYQQRLDEEQGE